MSAPRSSMPHLPALDGLRGLAVAGVLLFHLGGALRGGYLGVDLFFVLSGYLITSLLFFEHDATGRVALGAFWARRAKRLLPALVAMLPPIAAWARWGADPASVARLRGDMIATLAYVANWRSILSQKSYWELFAAPSLLEHTWSLAIEEQFYVGWPLVVTLVLRRGGGEVGRRRVLGIALALAAASMVAMVAWFEPGKTSRSYFGTDTRIAAILFGAALSAVLPPAAEPRRWARPLGPLALVAAIGLGVAWVLLDGQSWLLYHGGLWLTEIAALVLVAAAVAAPRSLVARALGVAPLRWLGTISYGLYLWHWPIFVVLTDERVPVGKWLPVVRVAVTFAVAIASYFGLESPIRRRGLPRGTRRWATLAGAAALLTFALVAARPRAVPPPPQHLGLILPPDEVRFPILVVGDSTANSLGWTLRGQRAPGVGVELKGQDGCTMLADMCHAAEWSTFVRDLKPRATLLFLGGAFMHGVSVDGRFDRACTREWHARFEKWTMLRVPELVAPGGRVFVVTLPYGLGPWESKDLWAEVDCINASLRKVAAAVPGVELLDLGGYLCPDRACTLQHRGKKIRPDGVHYDIEGALGVSRWVLERVGALPADGGR